LCVLQLVPHSGEALCGRAGGPAAASSCWSRLANEICVQGLGRRDGCGDPVGAFCPPGPLPSRRWFLQRCSSAREVCTGVNRPAAAASFAVTATTLKAWCFWSMDCGRWRADLPFFSDFVGRSRRICSPASMGMIPGRRAPEFRTRRSTVGRSIGSQSYSSDGASTDLGLLAARLPFLRRCFGGDGEWRRASKTMCARTAKDWVVFLCFWWSFVQSSKDTCVSGSF